MSSSKSLNRVFDTEGSEPEPWQPVETSFLVLSLVPRGVTMALFMTVVSRTVWTETRQLVEQRSHMIFWASFPCLYLEMKSILVFWWFAFDFCCSCCFSGGDLGQVTRRISACSIAVSGPASWGHISFVNVQQFTWGNNDCARWERGKWVKSHIGEKCYWRSRSFLWRFWCKHDQSNCSSEMSIGKNIQLGGPRAGFSFLHLPDLYTESSFLPLCASYYKLPYL